MRNFKFTLSYDGTRYCGFQRQPDQVTVQGVFEGVLSRIVEGPVRTVGAGRTDAGVHALGQVVSAKIETRLTPEILDVALNSALPRDIRVEGVAVVPNDFHARYSALERHYRYLVLNRRWGVPFWESYAWHVPTPLDLEGMRRGASYLVGDHDFSAFRAGGHGAASGRCRLLEVTVDRPKGEMGLCDRGGDLIVIRTRGTNYLHSMIRNMVGTLVEVGTGKRIPREMEIILESRDRTKAGPTAPPQGLYLLRIVYPDEKGIG